MKNFIFLDCQGIVEFWQKSLEGVLRSASVGSMQLEQPVHRFDLGRFDKAATIDRKLDL